MMGNIRPLAIFEVKIGNIRNVFYMIGNSKLKLTYSRKNNEVCQFKSGRDWKEGKIALMSESPIKASRSPCRRISIARVRFKNFWKKYGYFCQAPSIGIRSQAHGVTVRSRRRQETPRIPLAMLEVQLKCTIWLSTRWQSVSWTRNYKLSCNIQVKSKKIMPWCCNMMILSGSTKVYRNVPWLRILATLHA